MRVYVPKLQHDPGKNDFAYRSVVPDPDNIPGDFLTVWSFQRPKGDSWPAGVTVRWVDTDDPVGDFACCSYGVLIAQPRVRDIVRRSAPTAELLPVCTDLGEPLDLWNPLPASGVLDSERSERLPDPRAPRTLFRRLAFHGSRISSQLFKVAEIPNDFFISDTPPVSGGIVEQLATGGLKGLSLLEVWNDEGRDLPEFDPLLRKYAAPLRHSASDGGTALSHVVPRRDR